MGEIRLFRVPVPPVAEQGRIVAKVNQLMSLCLDLETALNTAQQRRVRFLEALLNEALEVGLRLSSTHSDIDQ